MKQHIFNTHALLSSYTIMKHGYTDLRIGRVRGIHLLLTSFLVGYQQAYFTKITVSRFLCELQTSFCTCSFSRPSYTLIMKWRELAAKYEKVKSVESRSGLVHRAYFSHFIFHVISLEVSGFRWNIKDFLSKIKLSWKLQKVCKGMFTHFTFFFMKHQSHIYTKLGNSLYLNVHDKLNGARGRCCFVLMECYHK